MKQKIISLAVLGLLAACGGANGPDYDYIENADDYRFVAADDTLATEQSVIKYSVPRDGDLTLETAHHVIKIQGDPNKQYAYHVWAGDKPTTDDPDLIVEDDKVMILQAQ